MFDIVVLDNEEWHLSIGFLGLGSAKVVDSSGNLVIATRKEKNFLQDVSRHLTEQKLEPSEYNAIKKNMLGEYSGAVHGRAGVMPFHLHGFLQVPPEKCVASYVYAYRKHGQK